MDTFLRLSLLIAPLLPWPSAAQERTGAALEDTIVVTGDRLGEPLADTPAAISVLGRREIELVSPRAPAELLNRVPGVFVQSGSGREHLTSIRSPVLTGGAGAGSFLFLTDGVPLRAPGFANVNGLFDAPLPFADRVEVVRGPGDVAYGSNALHGAVNVLTPEPGSREGRLRGSVGSFQRYGALLEGGNGRARGGISLLDDGGYRDQSGAFQAKAYGAARLGAGIVRLTGHHLEQETAGFVVGPDAYRDDELRRSNPDPNAFRDVRHVLLSADLPFGDEGWEGRITPYARWTDMDFRLHFLPGEALEENAHGSVGIQSVARRSLGPRLTGTLGLDADLTRGTLREFQAADSVGSFVEGLHYDYRVNAAEIAPFGKLAYEATPRLTVEGGVRLTATRYAYENRAPGLEVIGRFRRPNDRDDRFLAATGKVSALYRLGDQAIYASLARGARPPQTTDLYRIQVNQRPDGISPETLDAAELGYRRVGTRSRLSLTAFAMKKENYFFRDADGFNVTDGETTHVGIEGEADVSLGSYLRLAASGTVARHAYAFTRPGEARELITDGNEVDTAPNTLASFRAIVTPNDRLTGELALTHVGSYFTDAANTQTYPGHEVLDARVAFEARPGVTLLGIVRNATDTRYARRADFAFGNERYFPGEELAGELALTVGF